MMMEIALSDVASSRQSQSEILYFLLVNNIALWYGTRRLRESLATAIDESLEKDYGVDLKIPEEAKDKFGILRFVTREGCNVVLCDLEGAPNHLRLNETKFYYDSLRSQPEIWVLVVKIGDQYMSIPSPFTQAQTENQYSWQPLSFSCLTRRGRRRGRRKR